jgi:transcription elongation GreA/GreB family factor
VKVADAEAAREYMNAASGDDRDLWREELASAEAEVDELEARLRLLMVPVTPTRARA